VKKNKFFGKYYKFVSKSGFSFAVISASSNEGEHIQLITKNKAYFNIDVNSFVIDGSRIAINIENEELVLKGSLLLKELHPLKKDVMGPFRFLPLECKHNIYSMYHEVEGNVIFNGHTYSLDYGYIEGDEGTNFPEKYIWYNSVSKDHGITFAIASIPIGPITFTGLICFISYKGQEYRMTTYNFGKVKVVSPSHIIISGGKLKLEINVDENILKKAHDLKAPIKGNMDRYIKENIAIQSKARLFHKNILVLDTDDSYSSYEYMF